MANFKELYALALTFTSGETAIVLKTGDEVYLSSDNSVKKRTNSDNQKLPIGVVNVGGGPGATVTVNTIFLSDLKGLATGSTLTAGALVRPNGTDNQYVATGSGDYSIAVVLQGGTASSNIRLGILRVPFKV